MKPGGDGLACIRALCDRIQFERIEAEVAGLRQPRRDVGSDAHSRIERGQPVSRSQAAAYLGVSTKKLQRMEAAGKLRRCPDLGSVVLYPARDVLRFASASSLKGA